MKDIVSVITAFYNDENYILQCIDSVLSQIVNNNFTIEYILVDDCSTDLSKEIVELYLENFNSKNIKVKIINTSENSGPGIAKRLGIKEATGNYFMFLDADDYYINKDFILRAHTIISKKNADIIEFGYRTITNGMHNYVISHESFIFNNQKFDQMKSMFIEGIIGFMPWTKIISRHIVESKEYDNDKQFDDVKTIPYWLYNSNKVIVINTIEINYRAKSDSIIRNDDNETSYKTIKALSSLFKYFKDNKEILKMIYDRCIIELRKIISLDSDSDYFKEMSKLNTYMLSYIYPNNYQNITYDID